ncbi:MAG: hypothetical protein HQL41_05230 [Alphaproteobacteria bacterium]|nr:hypothetical protein [Alphaproteobacteria bacterium]
MTEDEFFEFVRTRDEKWELIDGEPMMMAGANQRHQDIAAAANRYFRQSIPL